MLGLFDYVRILFATLIHGVFHLQEKGKIGFQFIAKSVLNQLFKCFRKSAKCLTENNQLGLVEIAELIKNAFGRHANVQMAPETGNEELFCFIYLLVFWHWSVGFHWKMKDYFFICPCCLWGKNIELICKQPAALLDLVIPPLRHYCDIYNSLDRIPSSCQYFIISYS